jgi:cell division protein DivIC
MKVNWRKIQMFKFTKNFYFVTFFLFFIWMLFFDANDFISQYQRKQKIQKLVREKAYYEQIRKELEQDGKQINTSNQVLEKFAREKYLMQQSKEDIYITNDEDFEDE